MTSDATREGAARFAARLLATVAAPLDPASADGPRVLHWPGRRLLVQRGDTELAVRDLEGAGAEVRFPAPWPRRYGSVAVSPAGDVAVFAGVHALRAVDSTGAVLWEIRHGCWSSAVCTMAHASFSEYADDYHHGHADSGSAAFSSDGKLLWAHVRSHMGHGTEEEWLVLDAADGSLLARVATMTVGSGSFHFPHPDSDRPPSVGPPAPGMSLQPGTALKAARPPERWFAPGRLSSKPPSLFPVLSGSRPAVLPAVLAKTDLHPGEWTSRGLRHSFVLSDISVSIEINPPAAHKGMEVTETVYWHVDGPGVRGRRFRDDVGVGGAGRGIRQPAVGADAK